MKEYIFTLHVHQVAVLIAFTIAILAFAYLVGVSHGQRK